MKGLPIGSYCLHLACNAEVFEVVGPEINDCQTVQELKGTRRELLAGINYLIPLVPDYEQRLVAAASAVPEPDNDSDDECDEDDETLEDRLNMVAAIISERTDEFHAKYRDRVLVLDGIAWFMNNDGCLTCRPVADYPEAE